MTVHPSARAVPYSGPIVPGHSHAFFDRAPELRICRLEDVTPGYARTERESPDS